ncbi:LOW QUALITY PROTEIN: hypothetical protein MXB_1991, partial [Myxobolus squamalis]
MPVLAAKHHNVNKLALASIQTKGHLVESSCQTLPKIEKSLEIGEARIFNPAILNVAVCAWQIKKRCLNVIGKMKIQGVNQCLKKNSAWAPKKGQKYTTLDDPFFLHPKESSHFLTQCASPNIAIRENINLSNRQFNSKEEKYEELDNKIHQLNISEKKSDNNQWSRTAGSRIPRNSTFLCKNSQQEIMSNSIGSTHKAALGQSQRYDEGRSCESEQKQQHVAWTADKKSQAFFSRPPKFDSKLCNSQNSVRCANKVQITGPHEASQKLLTQTPHSNWIPTRDLAAPVKMPSNSFYTKNSNDISMSKSINKVFDTKNSPWSAKPIDSNPNSNFHHQKAAVQSHSTANANPNYNPKILNQPSNEYFKYSQINSFSQQQSLPSFENYNEIGQDSRKTLHQSSIKNRASRSHYQHSAVSQSFTERNDVYSQPSNANRWCPNPTRNIFQPVTISQSLSEDKQNVSRNPHSSAYSATVQYNP